MNPRTRYLTATLLTIILLILLNGCVDAVPKPDVPQEPYGFLFGVWHGMIIFFSFIGSLLSDDIAIYGVNNTGGWYDFGFLLGLGTFSGASYTSSQK